MKNRTRSHILLPLISNEHYINVLILTQFGNNLLVRYKKRNVNKNMNTTIGNDFPVLIHRAF